MTLHSTDITIVIPHYGDPNATTPLIDHLLSDDVAPARIVVVDDASPEAFPSAYRGITVLRRTHNGGFGSTVNTGAKYVSTSHMLVLNSDVEVPPSFLELLAREASPWMPAVAAPRMVAPDGTDAYVARRFQHPRHHVVEWLTALTRARDSELWHKAVGHDLPARGPASRPTDWLSGACLLIPTDWFAAVGGFDEQFHMNSEEVDLQLRLSLLGIPRVFLGGLTIVHEGGGSSEPAKRRLWVTTSRFAYARKWTDARALRIGLTAATAVNLAINTVRRTYNPAVHPLIIFRDELATIRAAAR